MVLDDIWRTIKQKYAKHTDEMLVWLIYFFILSFNQFISKKQNQNQRHWCMTLEQLLLPKLISQKTHQYILLAYWQAYIAIWGFCLYQ